MSNLFAWRENAEKVYQLYNEKIKGNSEAIKLFHGFKVWYSPVKFNPKILIIGINPGIGESTLDKNINFNESINFEYLPHNPKYILANQIKKVFNEAGLSNMLEKETIKTNYYHIITKDQFKIKFGLELIEKNLSKQYENDAKQIIDDLIRIIKPKYIICEGKSIYDKVVKLYSERGDSKWEYNSGYTKINNPDLTIFGCSRIRSFIKNKSHFSELLREHIK